MSNYIPEASYDKYAGSAQYDDQFTYFDYVTPTSVVTNETAINNAIRNILTTRIGSLPGKPSFGSNVMNIVFELIDGKNTVDILKNNIMYSLIKWEPRISINSINVKEIPEYNRIVANISYSYNILGANIDASTSILLND
jgi:phage baseplate assembly protein W